MIIEEILEISFCSDDGSFFGVRESIGEVVY